MVCACQSHGGTLAGCTKGRVRNAAALVLGAAIGGFWVLRDRSGKATDVMRVSALSFASLAVAAIATHLSNVCSMLDQMRPMQLQLISPAAGSIERAEEAEVNHGEVFTRRWVADLVLDFAGYTEERDLGSMIAYEPSCGAGAFIKPLVERLMSSLDTHGGDISDCDNAIRAFDLLPKNVELARGVAIDTLASRGVPRAVAQRLAIGWIQQGDFLLRDHTPGTADFVVGNPPYIRPENVPAGRSAAYRRTCETMRGRSDIYVGFLEVGMRLLVPEGVLAFIVADRWMRNQYGKDLRKLIAAEYAVDAVIEMHDVNAFEEPVSAYPAITVLRRGVQRGALVAETNSSFGPRSAEGLSDWHRKPRVKAFQGTGVSAAKLGSWFGGDSSWPMGHPKQLALLADLEARFPLLEDAATGTRVGIGVATGADQLFITRDASLVEDERLLPLALAKDIASGELKWSGTYLVNPWENGRLVELHDFPKLSRYFEAHREQIKNRHIAQRNRAWFRTIDRVEPGLLNLPKLLLPDIKSRIHPVLDEGEYYPHHNLYFVTSREWPIEALGGLLLSDLANLFVGMYCVKMRGGCYRFQAQYLRRIRVPALSDVADRDLCRLAEAFRARDIEESSSIARSLYGVDKDKKV